MCSLEVDDGEGYVSVGGRIRECFLYFVGEIFRIDEGDVFD